MPEPSDHLRELAAQGRSIRAQYLAAMNSRRTAPERITAGVDVLDYFFDFSGYKKAASRVGKVLIQQDLQTKLGELQNAYANWYTTVMGALGELTLVSKTIPSKSNSTRLQQSFRKTQSYNRMDTKMEHGAVYLEQLAEKQLIRNKDLLSLYKTKEENKPKQKQISSRRGITDRVIIDGELLLYQLGALPEIRESIKGAISVYESRSSDYGRQALSSCRNAMENLVRHLSGDGDWRAGLCKIVTNEEQRKNVGNTYNLLSRFGTHGSNTPSEEDVELGLRSAFLAIEIILRGNRFQAN